MDRERRARDMPEKAIYDVMEASSGPHFSGVRLDSRCSSPSSAKAAASAASGAAVDGDYSLESPKQPFVIGVSGGSASGKTTVCDMIIQQLHDHRVVLVYQFDTRCDLKKIEKIARAFLWNGTEGCGMHYAAWHTVCKPKAAGGLGILDLCSWRKALLARHAYRFYSGEESLLHACIKAKYGINLNVAEFKWADSPTWRLICMENESRLCGRLAMAKAFHSSKTDG